MHTEFNEIFKPLNEIFSNYFLDTDEDKKCPKCGGDITLKSSKTGCFFGCNNYPNCNYARSLEKNNNNDKQTDLNNNKKVINHKIYGEIVIKNGPYGCYCEYSKDGKIKRNSLPKEEITPQILDFYLSLPLELGKDENGKIISTNIGRFGPYVLCDGKFYSYKKQPYDNITLETAKETIEEAKNKLQRKSDGKKKIVKKTNSKKIKHKKSK